MPSPRHLSAAPLRGSRKQLHHWSALCGDFSGRAVSALRRHLSWTHIRALIYPDDPLRKLSQKPLAHQSTVTPAKAGNFRSGEGSPSQFWLPEGAPEGARCFSGRCFSGCAFPAFPLEPIRLGDNYPGTGGRRGARCRAQTRSFENNPGRICFGGCFQWTWRPAPDATGGTRKRYRAKREPGSSRARWAPVLHSPSSYERRTTRGASPPTRAWTRPAANATSRHGPPTSTM